MGNDWIVWGVVIAIVGTLVVIGWLAYIIVRNATQNTEAQ